MKITIQTLNRDHPELCREKAGIAAPSKGCKFVVQLPNALLVCEAVENDEIVIRVEAAEVVTEKAKLPAAQYVPDSAGVIITGPSDRTYLDISNGNGLYAIRVGEPVVARLADFSKIDDWLRKKD